jgi:hypothetical protein
VGALKQVFPHLAGALKQVFPTLSGRFNTEVSCVLLTTNYKKMPFPVIFCTSVVIYYLYYKPKEAVYFQNSQKWLITTGEL